MGATLVAQAIARWSHVSHQSFRALMAMALTAKDNASKDVPACLYFGGHAGLVHALLFTEGTTHESKLRAVRLAVKELESGGAVVCTKEAYSGGRAVYKLTLDSIPIQANKRPRKVKAFYEEAETRNPPEAETRNPPEAETRHPAEADTWSPPYKEPLEEPLKEQNKDEGIALRTDIAVVGQSPAVNDLEEITPRCRNPECVLGNVIDDSKPKGKRITPCPECNPPNNIIQFGRRTA